MTFCSPFRTRDPMGLALPVRRGSVTPELLRGILVPDNALKNALFCFDRLPLLDKFATSNSPPEQGGSFNTHTPALMRERFSPTHF
jgi:hypothetical protein